MYIYIYNVVFFCHLFFVFRKSFVSTKFPGFYVFLKSITPHAALGLIFGWVFFGQIGRGKKNKTSWPLGTIATPHGRSCASSSKSLGRVGPRRHQQPCFSRARTVPNWWDQHAQYTAATNKHRKPYEKTSMHTPTHQDKTTRRCWHVASEWMAVGSEQGGATQLQDIKRLALSSLQPTKQVACSKARSLNSGKSTERTKEEKQTQSVLKPIPMTSSQGTGKVPKMPKESIAIQWPMLKQGSAAATSS